MKDIYSRSWFTLYTGGNWMLRIWRKQGTKLFLELSARGLKLC